MARILVVDDDPPNVEILSRVLRHSGHEVAVAQSRDGAIASLQKTSADLVLMDIHIPNSDGDSVNDAGGLEATRWIKSNPATTSVPVIALSASAMLDERKQCAQAGCDDFQQKPFVFGDLLQTVQRHLRTPK